MSEHRIGFLGNLYVRLDQRFGAVGRHRGQGHDRGQIHVALGHPGADTLVAFQGCRIGIDPDVAAIAIDDDGGARLDGAGDAAQPDDSGNFEGSCQNGGMTGLAACIHRNGQHALPAHRYHVGGQQIVRDQHNIVGQVRERQALPEHQMIEYPPGYIEDIDGPLLQRRITKALKALHDRLLVEVHDPLYVEEGGAQRLLDGLTNLGIVEHHQVGVEDGTMFGAHLPRSAVAEPRHVILGLADGHDKTIPLPIELALGHGIPWDDGFLFVKEHKCLADGYAR